MRGLTLDVGGTLLHPAEPVGLTYRRYGAAFGVSLSPDAIGARFKLAFARPGPRQTGDGRPFWRLVVAASTGCEDPALFEALYAHYTRPEAWRVADYAREALAEVRAMGVRTAALSNWDTRLPALLDALGFTPLLDAVVCSGEAGFEKPDPRIFHLAAQRLGLPPREILHVGDSIDEDIGAEAAGMRAWIGAPDFRALPGMLRPG